MQKSLMQTEFKYFVRFTLDCFALCKFGEAKTRKKSHQLFLMDLKIEVQLN